jgi:hypothetical protein
MKLQKFIPANLSSLVHNAKRRFGFQTAFESWELVNWFLDEANLIGDRDHITHKIRACKI